MNNNNNNIILCILEERWFVDWYFGNREWLFCVFYNKNMESSWVLWVICVYMVGISRKFWERWVKFVNYNYVSDKK